MPWSDEQSARVYHVFKAETSPSPITLNLETP